MSSAVHPASTTELSRLSCGIIFPWHKNSRTEVGVGWAKINAAFVVKKKLLLNFLLLDLLFLSLIIFHYVYTEKTTKNVHLPTDPAV